MSYFYGSPRGSRGSLFGYFLAGTAGVVIGALLVLYLAPALIAQRLEDYSDLPRFSFPAPAPSPVAADPSPVVYAAETVAPAVVGVVNRALKGYDWFGRPYVETSTGSGVIISANGYIVTNHHVIANTQQLTVFLADGSSHPATVVGSDPPVDLAVIKVDLDDLPHAQFGDSDALRVGELAVAIGNPLGLDFRHSVTAGVISGIDRILQVGESYVRLLQTDAVINPGNSGGPLVNAAGYVIGINTLKLDMPKVEGMGFAIPSNIVRRIVEDLIRDGKVRRPWLGVTIVDRATISKYQLDVKVEFERGVLIQELVAGSPAQVAGLKPGDVIIELGSRRIDDIAGLQVALREHRVGETVPVKVLRGGQPVVVDVKLGEVPGS
jgi:serine protease Do